MISIKHLSKSFKNPDGSVITVLKDVNCDIEKGEVISIIGPSGCGKSTSSGQSICSSLLPGEKYG